MRSNELVRPARPEHAEGQDSHTLAPSEARGGVNGRLRGAAIPTKLGWRALER